jgi:hypothetical protein
MKLKVVTTVSNNQHPLLAKLEHSLKLGEFDYKIIHNPSIGWDWGGWDNMYRFLRDEAKTLGYTHIIYTDGFDTLALGNQKDAEQALTEVLGEDLDRMVYSVEKHWFPHEQGWEEAHRAFNELPAVKALTPEHRWRYVNGGQYGGSVDALMWWYENAPKHRNNQGWGNEYYALHNQGRLVLDFDCKLFQTLSHSGSNHGSPEEFAVYNNRLVNNLTRTKPVFVHNNGIKNPTEAQFMYDILGV